MSSQHTDVGAYSLGLLEQADMRDFEAHLGECESCTAELAEFSHMAGLLAGVEPVDSGQDEPAEAAVVDLVRRRATALRRRAQRQVVLAAAAGLALLAGGVVTGIAAAPGPSPVAGPLASGQLHSATDPVTGVTGTVSLVAKPFGTQVTLELAKVRGPLECQLVAVSRTGERRIIAGWFVPSSGYGVPGHPARLIIAGGTAIGKNELSSVVVEVVHGGALLTIPV